MEHLSENFGRLTTTAREWTPSQQTTSQEARTTTGSSDWNAVDSELNAASVKEFVPGKGWSTQNNFASAASTINEGDSNPYATGNGGYDAQGRQSQPQEQPTLPPQGEDHQASFPSTQVSAPAQPPAYRSFLSLGMSDDLWRHHRELARELARQMDPLDPRHKAVPAPYCHAYCLDDTRSSYGYPSHTFQVISREDGNMYCLRRYDGVKGAAASPKVAASVYEQWAGIMNSEHSGLVQLHNLFVAQRALFFVYQLIPGAVRLRDRLGGFSEQMLWSAICQLCSVVRRVHQAGLAVRTLDLKHVLVKSDSMQLQLTVNCVGVPDCLEFEARKPLEALQMEDIRMLGRLILSMATGTEITPSVDANTIANCERYCLQTYSRELHNLAMTLIRSPTPPNILDVSRALAGRVWDEFDNSQLILQHSQRALGAEYESGRALRLLLKLGFVNERPEFGPNRRWAQSGDCYVLTLFRDYVFHQADGAGNPVMDLGHVVTSLNKLDAADEEKIVLSSRDGKSLMVVSYADVARCLDSAYHELCAGSVPLTALQQQPF